MFSWEDPESQQIVEWDDLEAHAENISRNINNSEQHNVILEILLPV